MKPKGFVPRNTSSNTKTSSGAESQESGKVYVGNLSFRTDNRSLHDAFSRFGEILDASVVMDRVDPSKSRGFAFVTFKKLSDAKSACLDMDGKNLDGRQIRVDLKQGGGGAGGGSRGGNDRRGHDNNRRSSNNYSGSGSNAAPLGRNAHHKDVGTPPSRAAPSKPSESSSSSDNKKGSVPTNCRVYISGLPTTGVSEGDIQKVFGMIGQVQRVKQKRGYPDQWPWKIKMYRDEKGQFKGDCILSYEDPNAAKTAPDFFNGYDFNGNKLSVVMAKEYVPKPGEERGGGDRGRGGGRRDDRYQRGGRRDYGRRDGGGGYRGGRR